VGPAVRRLRASIAGVTWRKRVVIASLVVSIGVIASVPSWRFLFWIPFYIAWGSPRAHQIDICIHLLVFRLSSFVGSYPIEMSVSTLPTIFFSPLLICAVSLDVTWPGNLPHRGALSLEDACYFARHPFRDKRSSSQTVQPLRVRGAFQPLLLGDSMVVLPPKGKICIGPNITNMDLHPDQGLFDRHLGTSACLRGGIQVMSGEVGVAMLDGEAGTFRGLSLVRGSSIYSSS
jgi:hypothetical protein